MGGKRRKLVKRLAVAGAVAGMASAAGGAVVIEGASPGKPISRVPTPLTHSETAEVVVQTGNPAPTHAVPEGFVGLSLEYNETEPYTGTNPKAINPLFVKLADGVAPGGGLVLRIGGNSSDRTWVPAAGVTAPNAVWYTMNDNWFSIMKGLAGKTGAHYIFDLNLLAHDKKLALAEADALIESVGRGNIKSFEIGNEPEFYAKPDVSSSKKDKHQLRHKVDATSNVSHEEAAFAKVLPPMPIADPATGSQPWLTDSQQLIAADPKLKELTFHRYPLNACVTDPADPAFPTVDHLLAPSAAQGLMKDTKRYIDMAHRKGITFRIDELNSVTCQGKVGVSNTFASALWFTDTLFRMVQDGVDGVNIHVHPGAVAGQLFTFDHKHGTWTAHVRPNYYGVTLFNRAAPAGSRLLNTKVTGGSPTLHTWATQTPSGKKNVVLINESQTQSNSVLVKTPASAKTCTIQNISAPSVYSTHGVTIDGQSFSPKARLSGRNTTMNVTRYKGGCRFTLPAASAADVTF